MSEEFILEGRNVQKSYGPTQALRGANVQIKRGEILAIMGPSGSGKTTLLHCLAGILQPTQGQVIFNDLEISKLSDDERTKLRRTQFGFVFQFDQLIPELTSQENVAIPMLLNGQNRKTALATASEWLDLVGLQNIKEKRSGELSGGQAQRVAIARALAIKPALLFADEPTGSLDSLNGEKVMEIFLEVVRQSGTTVVIVTHEPRIAAYADREIIVRDGIVATRTGAFT